MIDKNCKTNEQQEESADLVNDLKGTETVEYATTTEKAEME